MRVNQAGWTVGRPTQRWHPWALNLDDPVLEMDLGVVADSIAVACHYLGQILAYDANPSTLRL